jgi:hypothetical protein
MCFWRVIGAGWLRASVLEDEGIERRGGNIIVEALNHRFLKNVCLYLWFYNI